MMSKTLPGLPVLSVYPEIEFKTYKDPVSVYEYNQEQLAVKPEWQIEGEKELRNENK